MTDDLSTSVPETRLVRTANVCRESSPRSVSSGRRSMCSPLPPARDRSPGCASASRRSRGSRWSTNGRRSGVSALEALAQLASRDLAEGDTIAAWIDAQRGEVFSALYRVGPAPLFTPERLVELEAPAVAAPLATMSAWSRHDLQVDDVRRRRSRALCADARGGWRDNADGASGAAGWGRRLHGVGVRGAGPGDGA